jgi:predicted Abi (CAAX) family protease
MIEAERPTEAPSTAPAAGPAAATDRRGSYYRFLEAEFNHPDYYPLEQRPDPSRYRPAATWLGRLILPPPEQRAAVMGALFEVHLAAEGYAHLVGQVVWLRWMDDPRTNQLFWSATRQVIFDEAGKKSAAQGVIVPERVNNWPLVNPFESLAGSLPADEMLVRLHEPVQVEEGEGGARPAVLYTPHEPAQFTGRYYALVRFLGPVEPGTDRFRVAHFNRQSGTFDGATDEVRLPSIVLDEHEQLRATSAAIERSPANEDGWYVYGAPDRAGTFVVQALAPRGLLRLRPGRVVVGRTDTKEYLKPKTWKQESTKGTFTTALLLPDGADPQAAVAEWREGDAALVVHLWGLIGGPKPEPSARTPLAWGHTSFGTARVVREPLAGELVFDIEYQQVYIHNTDGIIAGTNHWTRYTGDRQFGWLGTRPVQDVIVRLDCFTEDFVVGTVRRSALDELRHALEAMTARYRIADGRGVTQLTPANNCSQDSNQSLYAAIRRIEHTVETRADLVEWRKQNPAEARRMERLLALGRDLRRTMLPLGAARADWDWGSATLGTSIAESPLRMLGLAARSWRAALPSVAARSVANVFLDHGAAAWVLRTNQVGGDDPSIAPFVPNV